MDTLVITARLLLVIIISSHLPPLHTTRHPQKLNANESRGLAH